jgi:predicted metalloendopeptidase
VLPLGLLHDPLFSLKTPSYLGLGTLGFIVAHEIMHGFDNSGVEFDEDGVRRNLLSPPSQLKFQQKMNCMSNQFSSAFRTEYLINGKSVVLKVSAGTFIYFLSFNRVFFLF